MARSIPDWVEAAPEGVDLETFDDKIASLLVAIEGEHIPDRLLKLANELQGALTMRRHMKNPN